MTKSEFIKVVKQAIKQVENGEQWTCEILKKLNEKIEFDYRLIFNVTKDEIYPWIPAGFSTESPTWVYDIKGEAKQTRLNALTLYMVQALESGTYKDL